MIQEIVTRFAAVGASCNLSGSRFFDLPTWYKYLKGMQDGNGVCTPRITNINDAWLIAMAVVEILLRVASVLAFFMIIYASFLYVTSQGEPDGTAKAKNTLINAILGLAISVSAVVIVNFIGRSVR